MFTVGTGKEVNLCGVALTLPQQRLRVFAERTRQEIKMFSVATTEAQSVHSHDEKISDVLSATEKK